MSNLKKSVLGRGLNALIPKGPRMEVSLTEPVGRDTGEIGIIASIEVARIQPNPFQPRTDFDEDALEELTRSILEKGVIQPVTVRRVGGDYQLITGERRLRAAQRAKLKQIPAYFIEVRNDEEMLELALIENIQREFLNPMDVAGGYQRLMTECHLSQEDVAQKVGKDRTTVTNFLRLLKLPEKIQEGLRKEKISMGHARALINVPNEKIQERLYDRIIDEGLSVRRIEDLARGSGKPPRKGGRKSSSSTSSNLQSIEEKLRHALGTKVVVRTKGGGKGEIVIEFYSLDDFDRLLDIISAGSRKR